MDDVKGKVKGLMKNLTTSNSKFKGQGRVLGSASSSIPNSRLIPPQNPNPNPRPDTKLNPPNPKPSAEFSPFDPLTTTTNRSPSSAAAFNCPICSSPFRSESEVSAHIDSCLATNPDVESANVVAESVGLYLSNRPPKESVEVVLRLLSNVVKEPGNEKFRRIRMGNPKIKEAVGGVKGGVELLECVGFRVGEEEEEAGREVWATMEVPAEDGVRMIREAVSLLEKWKEGGGKEESVAINGGGVEENRVVERKKIDRKVRVFFPVPESVAAKMDLPDSFYNLSMDEIKREADLRKKKIAESQLLIPKSYKEKQAIAARKKYKLTVIRIQFPDGVVLQGIFLPSEPTTAVYEIIYTHQRGRIFSPLFQSRKEVKFAQNFVQFVSSSLKEPCLEFELLSPAVARLRVIPRFTTVGDRRPPTLEEERLVPSALVKFKPIVTDSIVFTGLTNELLEASEPLTSSTNVL